MRLPTLILNDNTNHYYTLSFTITTHTGNPNFTGREHELDELRSRFSDQDMGRQRIVSKVEVAGMGGVGKTQLVTEVSKPRSSFMSAFP